MNCCYRKSLAILMIRIAYSSLFTYCPPMGKTSAKLGLSAKSSSTIRTKRELSQAIGEVSRLWREEKKQTKKTNNQKKTMRQVLMQLHRHPDGMPQGEQTHKQNREHPTLVRLLDQLESRKWIARVQAQEDKRRKYVVLTPKAAEQICIIEKLSQNLRDRMMDGLSPEEVRAGLDVLKHLRSNLLA